MSYPAAETAFNELAANLRRMEQRHQAVGYKFDRLYDLIAEARKELAAAPPALPDPERFMDERGYTVEAAWLRSDDATSDYRNAYTQPVYTEQQVRALLAASTPTNP